MSIISYIREVKTVDFINDKNADYATRDVINKNYVPVSERLFIPDNNSLPENWYFNPTETLVGYSEYEFLVASSYYDATNGTHDDFNLRLLMHICGKTNPESASYPDYMFYIKLTDGFDDLVRYSFPEYYNRGRFYIMGMNTVGSDIELTIINQTQNLSTIPRDGHLAKLSISNELFHLPTPTYEKVFIS
jgi:hypothetical protein